MRGSAHFAIRTIGYSDDKIVHRILTESHASFPRAFTKIRATACRDSSTQSRNDRWSCSFRGFRNQSDTHPVGNSVCVTNVKNRSSSDVPEVASTRRSTRLNIVGLSSPGDRWHAWPHALMVKSTRAFLSEY